MICVNKKNGFTLIEMLVALFIISIAATFVMVVTGTIKVTRDSTYEHIAFRIADSKLDELRALGYTALSAGGPFFDPGLANLPQGAASTSVADWNAKTKRVMTGVSWQGADGLTRFVSLTTLVTEVGGL
ncbi:MAG: type II secretion system protein [Patescibacteria group bacterium]